MLLLAYAEVITLLCFYTANGLLPGKGQKQTLKVTKHQCLAWNRGYPKGYIMGYWHADSLLFTVKNGVYYG